MIMPATFLPRASQVRLAVLGAYAPYAGATGCAPALTWPPKDPADVLDYVLDVSEVLAGDTNDNIVSLDVEVTPVEASGLVVNSTSVDGERVIIWLAGGNVGSGYTVTVTVVTAAGRSIARGVQIQVVGLAPGEGQEAVLTDETGQVILDENNNPILQ